MNIKQSIHNFNEKIDNYFQTNKTWEKKDFKHHKSYFTVVIPLLVGIGRLFGGLAEFMLPGRVQKHENFKPKINTISSQVNKVSNAMFSAGPPNSSDNAANDKDALAVPQFPKNNSSETVVGGMPIPTNEDQNASSILSQDQQGSKISSPSFSDAYVSDPLPSALKVDDPHEPPPSPKSEVVDKLKQFKIKILALIGNDLSKEKTEPLSSIAQNLNSLDENHAWMSQKEFNEKAKTILDTSENITRFYSLDNKKTKHALGEVFSLRTELFKLINDTNVKPDWKALDEYIGNLKAVAKKEGANFNEQQIDEIINKYKALEITANEVVDQMWNSKIGQGAEALISLSTIRTYLK